MGRALVRCLVCVQTEAERCGVPNLNINPGLCGAVICQALCCAACFALVLAVVALGQLRMPVELFWWPQSSWLGGAGFPPPEDMQVAVLKGRCPAHPGRITAAAESKSGGSIRAPPRWILDDLPCLNASQLDAGVCVRTARGAGTMRCLPSFLVIGAQKAGSTDLRGLLSFHPYLDGPSSEVRFFTHVTGEESLERRWREYLKWFPVWRIPAAASSTSGTVASTVPNAGGAGGTWTGTQWTYEKSPAYLGSPLAPRLAHLLVPSAKLVAILRNPTSRAYSAFQHNCRFGRWRRRKQTQAQAQAQHPSSGGGGAHQATILNCGTKADHDEKVPKDGAAEAAAGAEEESTSLSVECRAAEPLSYPCRASDFHALLEHALRGVVGVGGVAAAAGAADGAGGGEGARTRPRRRLLLGGEEEAQELRHRLRRQLLRRRKTESRRRLDHHFHNHHHNHLENTSNATDKASPTAEALLRVKGEAGSIISKGLYALHLREWLEFYRRDQLKVLLFEDFYKNVRRIPFFFCFLGGGGLGCVLFLCRNARARCLLSPANIKNFV